MARLLLSMPSAAMIFAVLLIVTDSNVKLVLALSCMQADFPFR